MATLTVPFRWGSRAGPLRPDVDPSVPDPRREPLGVAAVAPDMQNRSDVAPSTVGVDLRDHGVAVEYLDGRETLYHGVPERVSGTLRTGPGKETHVLVTDPTETEGVMLYVNDLNTHDEILEDTGVGRVMLDAGEEEEVFPGVTVRRVEGHRTAVTADPAVARGRVFVFVEDEWGEQSYEFVSEGEDVDGRGSRDDAGDDGETGADADSADGADR